MTPVAIQSFEAVLERVPGRQSFRMPGTQYPWSITPPEGRFLYEIAKALCHRSPNGKSAYALEIATAFGYSACWIGMGLDVGRVSANPNTLDRHGVLVTMDPYTEEVAQSDRQTAAEVWKRTGITIPTAPPRGHTTAQRGLSLCGIGNVRLVIGASPWDVPDAVSCLDDEPFTGVFDLVFIDGHHLNGQPLKDWKAVRPYITAERTIVCWHDSHVPDVKEAYAAAEEFFGGHHYNPGLPGFEMIATCGNGANVKIIEEAGRTASAGNPYR